MKFGQDMISLEAQCLYRKGKELSSRGRHDAALKCLRQAVMIAPRFGQAITEIGHCLNRLGRYGEAVDYYDRAHRITPHAAIDSPAPDPAGNNKTSG